MGAAMATALSYLVWIWTSLLVSERLWAVGFPILVLATQIALGAAAVTWMTLVDEISWISVLGVHVVVVLLFILSLDSHSWGVLRQKFV
jgi:uncharacterized membrane protein YdbT with pleckstrin-like domain